jgi:hypothetical protein
LVLFFKKGQQAKDFFLKKEAKTFVCFGSARWGPSALQEPISTPTGITANAFSARRDHSIRRAASCFADGEQTNAQTIIHHRRRNILRRRRPRLGV